MVNSIDTDERSEDLLILEALGLASDRELESLDRIAGSAAGSRLTEKRSKLRELVGLIGLSVSPRNPAPGVKTRVMNAIRHKSGQVSTLRASEGWQPHEIEGVRYKKLSQSGNRVTVLMDLDPGVVYPRHAHQGDEDCYVIEGSFTDGKQTWSAGDFVRAPEGSAHGPLSSTEGCVLLLTVVGEDYRSPAMLA